MESVVPTLNLPGMQEEPQLDLDRLPTIRKKIDFFVEDLIVEDLNTSRPESAQHDNVENNAFDVNDIEEEFDLQQPQTNRKVVIENFDVEKFKKQPCGEEILKEYEIDGE